MPDYVGSLGYDCGVIITQTPEGRYVWSLDPEVFDCDSSTANNSERDALIADVTAAVITELEARGYGPRLR